MPTGNKRIDWQQQRIYSADWFVTEHCRLPQMRSIATIQAWVKKIERSKWFKSRFWTHPDLGILIRSGPRASPAVADSKWRVILLPPGMREKVIVLHELAHICNQSRVNHRKSHGKHFAGIFLLLVRQYMSKRVYQLMKKAFNKFGVQYIKYT